ncbi:MAG: ImmA/IrrE family metallo-endopeptidase [Mesorhizobium sp.]|uniref:ImmA/IrrE family metallo-endopeptidase n=1 Tax=Mesorhizobium sp. TaxID=1871066 RepID=UPI000FE59C01|nr:ImmA/IrrE family metallo-endopeptidase [Mesorhizobium sp.]RWE81924.1 MAG: ImmA/IrrE family metallo-endopeptidase [Mesorhizobium sp.]TJW62292.1 MAG: ImmA/IrrE family metallo-endopeptidase [Mesorhizobium sp.]
MSMRDLSKRLQMDVADLRSEIEDKSEPGLGIIGKVARELSLPKFAFFMPRPPEMNDALPDFRSDQPEETQKSRQTVEVIQFARSVQRTAINLAKHATQDLPKFAAISAPEVEAFASQARAHFRITLEDQREAKDAKAFYTVCRKKIEDKGIFVLHASFPSEDGSGFCLAHPVHPIIVVNTKNQTRARRLFTLIHELAHVLMGKTGISDPFVRKNAVERRCNRFAGAFLAPKAFIRRLLKNVTPPKRPDTDDVAWASRRLKISQEASVLRLEQLGIFEEGSHAAWLAAVKGRGGNPDYSEKGGGGNGEPPPQEKTKLARYGFHFAQVFSPLLAKGQIDPINLYRTTGLKPTYQKAYFDYAKSLTSAQLQDLDLDDE